VGIAGSTKVGSYTTIAGQVGLAGHLRIGDRVTIAAQSGVMHHIPEGQKWLGSPAQPDRVTKRQLLAIERLPELLRRVGEIERRLATGTDDRDRGWSIFDISSGWGATFADFWRSRGWPVMKTSIKIQRGVALCVALFAITIATTAAHAVETIAPKHTEGITRLNQPAPPARKYPFRGTVHSVDAGGGWIQLEGRKMPRSLKVMDTAHLEREGRKIGLGDVQMGDMLKGSLMKDEAGQELVVKATVESKTDGGR